MSTNEVPGNSVTAIRRGSRSALTPSSRETPFSSSIIANQNPAYQDYQFSIAACSSVGASFVLGSSLRIGRYLNLCPNRCQQGACFRDDAVLEPRVAHLRGAEHWISFFVVVNASLARLIEQYLRDHARGALRCA